jgi:hypothetical protein
MAFNLTETAGRSGERLATVSFPFAEGEMPRTPPGPPFARGGVGVSVQAASGAVRPAQGRILHSHRDGSVRRAMIRFPWNAQANATETFTVLPLPEAPQPAGLLSRAEPFSLMVQAGPRTVRTDGMGLVLTRGDQEESRVSFTGVQFPVRFLGPEVTVIEDGPYFTWASLTYIAFRS